MPNQPKTPTRPIRIDLDEWAAFGNAAYSMGTDRSTAIRAFIAWYLRHPNATLPQRPAPPHR